MEQFVEQQGGEQQFNMMMMMQTREMLVQGYALDALFRHEKHGAHRRGHARRPAAAMNPQQNPKRRASTRWRRPAAASRLREAAERMKANRWLVDHAIVNVVDPRAAQAAPEAAAAPAGEDAAKDASAPAAEDVVKEG